MLASVVLAGGLLVGLVAGRWWALLAAAGAGAWIGVETDVEVPHWLFGAWYGVLAAAGITIGVLVRKARLLRQRS